MPTGRHLAIGLIAFVALMAAFAAGGPGNALVAHALNCHTFKTCPPTTTTSTTTTTTTTSTTTTTTSTTTTTLPPTTTTTASSKVRVSIGNATVGEGNAELRALWFAVTLSARSTSTVSVRYATVSGTATAGSDFRGGSGTLTIPAGARTRFVAVTVNGDPTFETSETFTVNLSSPVGATIARGAGVATIVNDDAGTCGISAAHPRRYRSVIVFAFENRTWNTRYTATVGGVGFGAAMPYLHSLGQRCASFLDWTETDTAQPSMAQYVGQVTGARQPGTVNNCKASTRCSTRANNIYRQARRRGLQAITYGEGVHAGCSSWPNTLLWGAEDRSFCNAQARPLTELNPNHLPNFAFIVPTRCSSGHDCTNATVDKWTKAHVQPVLDSAAYRAGTVAVFIWYDEDRPVPNMWITPTARSGVVTAKGAGYAGTLKAWESMLGLPCLANACTAPDMRTPANS